MTWQSWALAILIVVFAALQYTLAWSAVTDLLHRPRVRGNSHTFWMLTILCIPVLGALAYGAIGPTSFRSSQVQITQQEPDALTQFITAPERPVNVTPFRKYSGRLSDDIPATRPGVTRSRAHSSNGPVAHIRRPGA
jgi:hypothetical protein